jgi:hypothetical protein
MKFLKSISWCLFVACVCVCFLCVGVSSATAQPISPSNAELNVRLTALENKVAAQDQKLDAILVAVKSLSPAPVPVVVPAPIANAPLSALVYSGSAGGCGQAVTYSAGAGACGTAAVDASASGCGSAGTGARRCGPIRRLFGRCK